MPNSQPPEDNTPSAPDSDLSQTPETVSLTKEECTWAMCAHLSSFLGAIIPFANIIAPLIICQIKKDEMPFAAAHAKECLNFQISILIYLAIAFALSLVLIGLAIITIIPIFSIIFTVIAAIKASEGQRYSYPLCLRLVS